MPVRIIVAFVVDKNFQDILINHYLATLRSGSATDLLLFNLHLPVMGVNISGIPSSSTSARLDDRTSMMLKTLSRSDPGGVKARMSLSKSDASYHP